MRLEITAGYIHLSFDQWEWKLPSRKEGRSAILDFIDKLKKEIPACDRDYDEETRTWFIKQKHLSIIQQLKEEFLQDKNQCELF